MRGPQVAAFAEKHGLKQISIADLIAYRQAREKLVERVGEFPVASMIGTLRGYAYVTPFDAQHHMAFVYGRIGDGKNMLDAPASRRHHRRRVRRRENHQHGRCSASRRTGSGVIVYLRDGTAGVPVTAIPRDARNRLGGGAQPPVARDRPRRADPEGSRDFLDPAA